MIMKAIIAAAVLLASTTAALAELDSDWPWWNFRFRFCEVRVTARLDENWPEITYRRIEEAPMYRPNEEQEKGLPATVEVHFSVAHIQNLARAANFIKTCMKFWDCVHKRDTIGKPKHCYLPK